MKLTKGPAEKLFKYLHENQTSVLTSKYKNQTPSPDLLRCNSFTTLQGPEKCFSCFTHWSGIDFMQ